MSILTLLLTDVFVASLPPYMWRSDITLNMSSTLIFALIWYSASVRDTLKSVLFHSSFLHGRPPPRPRLYSKQLEAFPSTVFLPAVKRSVRALDMGFPP